MTRTAISYLRASVPMVATIVVFAGVAPAGACRLSSQRIHGTLQDLQPSTTEPIDGARASLLMAPTSRGGTRFVLRLRLRLRAPDKAAAGTTYGAHLYTGPCVAGDGAAAGPHYNDSTTVPPVVNDQTEVWLDFTLARQGRGRSATEVPFVPTPGARSIVIHAMPTDPAGAAGVRLACLPVVWS